MKPVEFPGQNVVFAKDQPEYLPLPAERRENGVVVSCWKMDWRERLRALFHGRIFVHQLTFHDPLQPLMVSTEKDGAS